jgi:ABC-type glycerol-3-phosphate transport system substrate-binding protein
LYSWNRSFAEDRGSFLSENLALYFGYGSEGREIEQLNPNLNFDIAQVPQSDGATVRRTYGKFYALSIMKTSRNVQGAAIVMQDLGGAELSLKIAQAYNLVPTLRSLVSTGSGDTYGQFNYQAAPIAYGWLNPSRSGADTVFRTLLQDLNENRRLLTDSTSDAVRRLQLEYN